MGSDGFPGQCLLQQDLHLLLPQVREKVEGIFSQCFRCGEAGDGFHEGVPDHIGEIPVIDNDSFLYVVDNFPGKLIALLKGYLGLFPAQKPGYLPDEEGNQLMVFEFGSLGKDECGSTFESSVPADTSAVYFSKEGHRLNFFTGL